MPQTKTAIKLIQPPGHVPGDYSIGGHLYLHTADDFDIRLSRLLEELTDIDKIGKQAALRFNLPFSNVNDLVFERFRYLTPESLNAFSPFDPFAVEVIFEDRRLPFDKLKVTSVLENEGFYEVEIFGGSWVELLEEVKANELAFGDFTVSVANILANWTADFPEVLWPVCDYNNLGTSGVTVPQLRPWFSAVALLEKAFCAIGWTLEGPFTESDYGKGLYLYLLSETFDQYTDKGNSSRVRASVSATYTQSFAGFETALRFDDDSTPPNHDPGGNYNNLLWQYTCPSGNDIDIHIEGQLVTDAIDNSDPDIRERGYIWVRIQKAAVIEKEWIFGLADIDDGFAETVIDLDLDYRLTNVSPGEVVVISFNILAFSRPLPSGPLTTFYPDVDVIEGTFFTANEYQVGVITDDIVPVDEMIEPEYGCLDIFKGVMHLIAGKVKTDYATKTVKLYPSFPGRPMNKTLEGFYQREKNSVDWTEKVQARSLKKTIEPFDNPRFIELGFQNSNDKFIEDTFQGEEPFRRIVDLGKGKVETKKLLNPFFEPTIERPVSTTDVGGTQPPYLPVLHEQALGIAESFDLGPRVCFYNGPGFEYRDPSNTVEIDFEGVIYTEWPYIYQSPNLVPITVDDSVGFIIELVYGNANNDLYRLWYERELKERFLNVPVEFLVYLNFNEYFDLDFRLPVWVQYNGAVQMYQIKEIADFSLERKELCRAILTTLEDC